MITFTEIEGLGYNLYTIMYAVELDLKDEDLCIDDVSDYRLGVECMGSCGYPMDSLSYDNIVEQMEELGFEFVDWDEDHFEFDKSRFYRGFGCYALEAFGKTARQVYLNT